MKDVDSYAEINRDVNKDSRPRPGPSQSQYSRTSHLSGYFMSNSVFVPAVLDSEGSIFKDDCVKSNKHRPILSAAKNRS